MDSSSANNKDLNRLIIVFSALTFLLLIAFPVSTNAQPDPLSSLTPEEIFTTSNIIKRSQIGPFNIIFVTISRVDPPKSVLAPFLKDKLQGKNPSSDSIPRKSSTVLITASSYKSYRIIVDLKGKVVESIEPLGTGVQPMLTSTDGLAARMAIGNNQTVMNRFKNLGLDPQQISISATVCGYYDDPVYSNRRIVQSFFSFSEYNKDNKYAHPLDFMTFIDVQSKAVIRIVEMPVYAGQSGPPLIASTLPRETSNYSPLLLPDNFYRQRIPSLTTTSDDSPAFTVHLKTNQVNWEKFQFQFSFDPKEALVLHDISYDKRPLIYRASLCEMFVPYMDPRNPWHYKHPLDEGEFGLGFDANTILPNSECNPKGRLIDVYVNNIDGDARLIPGAICIHEEDGGLLHKHRSRINTITTRARELVIFFVATVGNYDYAFRWKFYQDGTIGMEVGMTGLLATSLTLDGKTPHGTRVLPQVNAPFHQHIFNVRLDTAFDGETNSVVVQDVYPIPDELDPSGQGMHTKITPLTTSLNSVTDINASTDRIWKILNPNSINPKTNKPVSWKLIPLNKPLLMAKPYGRVYKRGEFAAHSMWVTTYKDGEFNAAGDYPNQSPGGAGLPKYVSRNDSIVGTDIVIWYTFGGTHIPRPEDFPIMNYEKLGFMLKPVNFFASYPGLDIPPTDFSS